MLLVKRQFEQELRKPLLQVDVSQLLNYSGNAVEKNVV